MRTIVEPWNSIKEGKDKITGKQLVHYNKKSQRWMPNRRIPRVRSGEEERVENYYEAKKDYFQGWELHHRLELTMDNEAALFMMDLINFGMYYHRPYFELIWLRINDHSRLHAYTRSGENSPMYGRTGDKHPRYEKSMSIVSRLRISNAKKTYWRKKREV